MRQHRANPYPHVSDYLRILVLENKIQDGNKILELTNQMQEWLSENVRCDGKNNYSWSENKIDLLVDPYQHLSFSDTISFRYETDLLAFRLRWGING
jgi:hypothetical protein